MKKTTKPKSKLTVPAKLYRLQVCDSVMMGILRAQRYPILEIAVPKHGVSFNANYVFPYDAERYKHNCKFIKNVRVDARFVENADAYLTSRIVVEASMKDIMAQFDDADTA